MDELTPIYRVEFFLDAIVNDSENPYSPIHRIEYYLAKIAGEDVEIPTPIYRIEYYLAKIAGEDVEIPSPIYRAEFYLAAICGEDVDVPEPLFRIEYWLAEWVEQSGGIEKTVIGNPIHITDALAKPVQALSISLEPIQDLHGYDNPWPAGGGKNLFDKDAIEMDKWIDAGSTTISTANGYAVTDYIPVTQGTIYYFGAKGSARSAYYDSDKNGIEYFAYNGGSAFTAQYTGFMRFTLYAVDMQALVSTLQFEKGNAATSYAPYSNICPISGHTDADVVRTGKNMADADDFSITKPAYSTQQYWLGLTESDGVFTLTRPIGWGGCGNVYIGTFPAGNYTVSFKLVDDAGVAWGASFVAKKKGTWETAQFASIGNSSSPVGRYSLPDTITITEPCDFWLAVGPWATNGAEVKFTDIQVELGSTATAYEPYVGTTYPFPLGQTVYGGTLDVVTGVLTVTMSIVDLGTLYWSYNANYGFISTTLSGLIKNAPQYNMPANILCSAYKTSNYQDVTGGITDKCIAVSGGNYGYLVISDSAYTDAAAFKTALSGVQLVYELATPQTIQLTPTQVELLQGENNLFSDGEMTLVYLADGNASDIEALNILLGGRYVNNHGEDEPTDREALDILLGRTK